MTTDTSKKNFYGDKIEEIRAIPILDVCRHFGVHVDFKGREPKCSIRSNDKTPSTVLHTEANGRFEKNTYHDFGTNETGDNIALACRLMGLNQSNKEDWYNAMDYLANTFQISPEDKSKPVSGELSDREYQLLGLYGDRATKNFRFDPERQSTEQMAKISQEYSMPLNELKKVHPHTFERLLKTIAIPKLHQERNDYYMYVWDTRRFLRAVMGENADITNMKEFEERVKELSTMEHLLTRAMIGTRLTPPVKFDYDPNTVLARIDSGDLEPDFGSRTRNQMKRLAEIGQTNVKYRALDLSAVYYRGDELFRDIPYSAFMNNKGQAVVRYLEKDEDRLLTIFEEYGVSQPKKTYKGQSTRLNDKLTDAQHRQAVQVSMAPKQCLHEADR